MRPCCTVTPVVGTSENRIVLLGSVKIASATSLPTLLASTSNAATTLDIADVVAAELDVHQAGDRIVRVGVLVVLQALDQGRGAVAQPHDRDANLTHAVRSFLRSVADARRCCPTGAVISNLLAFVVDQLVEPCDVGLGGRARVLHERALVAVGGAGVAQVRLDLGQSLLQSLTPALEQPDASLGRQVPEEGQPHAEPRVLGLVLLGRLLQQLEEQPLTLRGDGVDGLATGACSGAGFASDRASRSRRRSDG